ncbi:MAG: T9SS type A sorting domain-containing protein [Bacteroidia bacterium]
MKKIFTLISIFLIATSGLFAQATPNLGFESWTHVAASFPAPAYDTPDSWNTLNPTTAGLGQITCVKGSAAGEYHAGSAAVKLITKSILGQTANGVATTGTINTTTQTIGGGISYTARPDSMIGFYKYTPGGAGDNGFAEIQLLGSGGDTDTVGYVRFMTPSSTVGTYTRFSKAIVYRSPNPVVKSIWILSSSKDATTHIVNSTAYFDDVNLVFASTANVVEQPKLQLTVGPNPSNGRLVINNTLINKGTFVLYDVTGRKITEKKLEGTSTIIDLDEFPIGLYIYAITDEKNNAVKTDKLIIQK